MLNDRVLHARHTRRRRHGPRSNASSGSNCDAARNASDRGVTAISLTGRTAVIVDDGIATGATARRHARSPARTARARWCWRFRSARTTSSRGSPDTPTRWSAWRRRAFFFAVGQGYRHFTQTSDDEVDRAARSRPAQLRRGCRDRHRRPDVRRCATRRLRSLAGPVDSGRTPDTSPRTPSGIVVFAHGSGSSGTVPAIATSPRS